MIISGNTFRSLLRDNKFSADFDLSFQNCTGISNIGFSGSNKTFLFSFTSGKIFDDQGRYFSSYLPNTRFSLSTNFSGQAYDYSIDANKICFSGLKNDFFVDRFFINTTGCNIDASIFIKGQKPSFNLNLNRTFITGSPITGYFTSNSISGVKIFTGVFDEGSNFYFTSLPTGYINVNNSGAVVLQQLVTGIGDFMFSTNFETSAGDYSQDVRISGIAKPFIDYIFSFSDGTNNLNTVSNQLLQSGLLKSGFVNLDYSYNTNDSTLIPSSLPIQVSLSYYSGVTGNYGQVSDISLESGGFGYISAPTIIFSGGFDANSVKALSAASDYFLRSDGKAFDFSSGQTIAFYSKSGTALPSPMVQNQTYYVRDLFPAAPPYFTISSTYGGSKFDITNTGGGIFYFYDPSRVASATAFLGNTSTDYASVTSIQMNSFGSGYSSIPNVIFSGGTGVINNTAPSIASGFAEMAIYTKSFTGFFNLSTGSNDVLLDYRASNYISQNQYIKTNSSLSSPSVITLGVGYVPSFDTDILVAKLTVSGINGNLIETYITGEK